MTNDSGFSRRGGAGVARTRPGVIVSAAALLGLLVAPWSATPAHAQGCVLIRQNAPAFGAEEQLVFTPGEVVFSFNYRQSYANDHYNGTQYQPQRKALGNNVINTQQLYDLGMNYTLSERVSLFGSVPVVNATWSIPEPTTAPLGPRREQNSSGVGDVSALARFWLLSPAKHPRGNVSAGIGFKAPTGDDDVHDEYPDLNGTNKTSKAVDQSIQPGDGGWGVLFDLQGYKRLRPVTFYGSGSYLANPRDTNNTSSIIAGLGFAGNPAFASLLKNSVPDQYVARAGAAFPVVKDFLTLSLGFRVEGVPRYDLFGASHGWRRPGYESFLEPGFVFTHGASTWSVYVPRALVRNRLPNPYTGMAGDATFPSYIVFVGYSYRHGGAQGGFSRPVPETVTPVKPPLLGDPGTSGDGSS